MFKLVAPVFLGMGNEDVEATEAWMAIGREVEVAVGPKGGKRLVAWGIDRLAQVFNAAKARRRNAHAPYIEATLSARHI